MHSPHAEDDMPRGKKAAAGESPAASRKDKFQNIQIGRDLAGMLKTVADDAGLSIGDLVDQLIRPTVVGKFRAILERQLGELEGGKAEGGRRRTG